MEITAVRGFAEYLVGTMAVPDAEEGSFEERLCFVLSRLGVVKPGERVLSFEEWHNYEERGGETYVAAAQVIVASQETIIARPFVSKAVIQGHETLEHMLRRRALLQSYGILVPELYSVADACINEQFVPHSVHHYLCEGQANLQVLRDVVYTAAALDMLGFPTFSFLHDMRADGQHAYYVDFGWDLWDPVGEPVRNAFLTLMAFAQRHLPQMRDEIERCYEANREQRSARIGGPLVPAGETPGEGG